MQDEQPYAQASKFLPIKKILFNNFIGGLAWAFGATIGLSIIIAVLTLITKQINFVPVVGSFTSQVVDFVIKTNPHFRE